MSTARSLPASAVVATVASSFATAATFLPWATSGTRTRSSYELVDVAGRAGVLSDSTAGLANLWFLVPVACGLALLGVAVRSVLLITVTAGTIGVTVVAGGLLVARSPLGAEPGLYIAAGLGAVAAGTGIGTLIMRKRRST